MLSHTQATNKATVTSQATSTLSCQGSNRATVSPASSPTAAVDQHAGALVGEAAGGGGGAHVAQSGPTRTGVT